MEIGAVPGSRKEELQHMPGDGWQTIDYGMFAITVRVITEKEGASADRGSREGSE